MSPEAFPKGFHVRKTIAFALVLALLLPIAAFWGWLVLSPKPPLLDGVPFSPLVLDRDGNLLRLGLSEDEKYRVRIRLNEVAPEMVRAVLLYEDRYFYRHPGVNPLSLLRASAGMLGGARRMGGSTITMQVARLRLGLSTTTLLGKFAQMARALLYEYHYGKGEILEAYFNLAPYGGNIEGVGAAARIFFRTTPGRLTRTESLALAVVPQNPVRRSPLNGPDFEAARARMQMLADAEDAPGGGQGAAASFGASSFALGRALPPLRVYGPARLPFGAPHVSSETLPLSRGGEPVYTCIDSGLQRLMERAIAGFAARGRRYGLYNAAALLIHWPSMELRGLVGSAGFSDAAISGQVDGTRPRRSPSSTLKPFI